MDKPLTLADIAEPRPSRKYGASAGFRIWRVLRMGWHLLLPRKTMRVVVRGGIRYRLNREGSIDRRLLKDGHWEPDAILHFFNGAKKHNANVFLDVGANLGYYSLLAARLGIFDEIHAFEPHPENYRRLLWHIKANKFDNVITPHNVAASDCARDMKIIGDTVVDAGAKEGIVISAKPLDDVLAYRGRNICMKIDVEGHEDEVMRGAENILANNNVFFQMEIWGRKTDYACALLARGFSLINRTGDDFYFVRDADNPVL